MPFRNFCLGSTSLRKDKKRIKALLDVPAESYLIPAVEQRFSSAASSSSERYPVVNGCHCSTPEHHVDGKSA